MKKLSANYASLSTIFFRALIFFSIFFISGYLKAQPQVSFSPLIQNLSLPVEITNANDGSNRLFIVEQGGVIKIFKNGAVLANPFIDLSGVIGIANFQGIWSIAFSPGYKTNNTFFLLYTDKNGTTKLMRYQASTANPDLAIPGSGVMLFSLPAKNTGGPHFGEIHFGQDGYLYVNLSDGSSPNRTTNFAQNGQVLMGKLLRINANNSNVPPYYTIPVDNPFINNPNVRDEIWALGFRNGWRWSFDRLTGDLWIADVGGEKWEEVNFRRPAQSAASNYGFPCYEANAPLVTTGCSNANKYVFPIFSYPHDSSFGGQTIIGGFVYRGSAYPALQGYYICSDFATANSWKIRPNGSGGWAVSMQSGVPAGIVSYGEDENAELYAVSLLGSVYKVQATAAVASGIVSEEAGVKATVAKSNIYPTLVDNSILILDLKEAYDFVKIVDISGREVMRKTLSNQLGRVSLNLPKLNAGMYLVQLTGKTVLQQKIFIAK